MSPSSTQPWTLGPLQSDVSTPAQPPTPPPRNPRRPGGWRWSPRLFAVGFVIGGIPTALSWYLGRELNRCELALLCLATIYCLSVGFLICELRSAVDESELYKEDGDNE